MMSKWRRDLLSFEELRMCQNVSQNLEKRGTSLEIRAYLYSGPILGVSMFQVNYMIYELFVKSSHNLVLPFNLLERHVLLWQAMPRSVLT